MAKAASLMVFIDPNPGCGNDELADFAVDTPGLDGEECPVLHQLRDWRDFAHGSPED
jgi:hypothetical protein